MVESGCSTAWPSNELRTPSEMLDVAAAAVLLLILRAAVQPLSYPDAITQVVVASETGVGIESSPGRVALATIGVPIDLRVRAAELPR